MREKGGWKGEEKIEAAWRKRETKQPYMFMWFYFLRVIIVVVDGCWGCK